MTGNLLFGALLMLAPAARPSPAHNDEGRRVVCFAGSVAGRPTGAVCVPYPLGRSTSRPPR